jgi:D-arabinose 1-dehydrogenase-like Zn-dependent alcohol dehydrogenase
MYQTKAYAAAGATSPVAATKIARRDPAEHDVQIEILFCGICHSDLHAVRNEWSEFMPTVYPIVPGHEIVGRLLQWARQLLSTSLATWPRSAAWWTRTAHVPDAKLGLRISART